MSQCLVWGSWEAASEVTSCEPVFHSGRTLGETLVRGKGAISGGAPVSG